MPLFMLMRQQLSSRSTFLPAGTTNRIYQAEVRNDVQLVWDGTPLCCNPVVTGGAHAGFLYCAVLPLCLSYRQPGAPRLRGQWITACAASTLTKRTLQSLV